MTRALLLLLGVVASSAWAQPTSLIQQLLNATGTAAPSGDVNNVGQTGHQAYLTFSNAPSHTCSSPSATGQLEYSFDNTTFTAFGTPTSSTTVGSGTAYVGQGAFGYVRFNLVSFDTTNCRATVWYTGTTAFSPFQAFQTSTACTGGTTFNQPLVLIPNSLTSLTSTSTCITEIVVNNSTASGVTISIQDGNGLPLLSSFVIPGNSVFNVPLYGIKLTGGIKWQAGSASALYGAVLGTQ